MSKETRDALLALKRDIHDHAVYSNSQYIPPYISLKVFDVILQNHIKKSTEDTK